MKTVIKKKTARPPYWEDVLRRRFGRLHVSEYAFTKLRSSYVWCNCDCSSELPVRATYLRNGHTVSCGCVARELSQLRLLIRGKNRDLREYKTWINIAKEKNIDPRWKKSFVAFFADMGQQPEGTSLVLRDSNRPYGWNNCFWKKEK